MSLNVHKEKGSRYAQRRWYYKVLEEVESNQHRPAMQSSCRKTHEGQREGHGIVVGTRHLRSELCQGGRVHIHGVRLPY